MCIRDRAAAAQMRQQLRRSCPLARLVASEVHRSTASGPSYSRMYCSRSPSSLTRLGISRTGLGWLHLPRIETQHKHHTITLDRQARHRPSHPRPQVRFPHEEGHIERPHSNDWWHGWWLDVTCTSSNGWCWCHWGPRFACPSVSASD